MKWVYNQKILEACAKEADAPAVNLASLSLGAPVIEITEESEYSVLDTTGISASDSNFPMSTSVSVSAAFALPMADVIPDDALMSNETTEATEWIPTKGKENGWHPAETNSKMPAEATIPTFDIATYLYESSTDWPDWIETLKSGKLVNMTHVLKGFAQPSTRGGLRGVVFEHDNKYTLRFLSPITQRFHTAKAHALHKGTEGKRYPAIRKVLIDMLEEAHIIRK